MSLRLLTIRRILDVCPFYYISLSREERSTNGKLGIWAVWFFLGWTCDLNASQKTQTWVENIPSKAPFISLSLSSIDIVHARTKRDIFVKKTWWREMKWRLSLIVSRIAIYDAVTCLPRELDKIQYCVNGTKQSPWTSTAAVETSSRQSPRLLLGDSVMLPRLMLHYNLWKLTSSGSLTLWCHSFFLKNSGERLGTQARYVWQINILHLLIPSECWTLNGIIIVP